MITGKEANIRARMAIPSPEAEKELARAQRAIERSEREEQNLFRNWLYLQQDAGLLRFVNPRSDKKTTIAVGHPDFSIWLSAGRSLLIEFKVAGGKLSKEQTYALNAFGMLGHETVVVRTHEEAIRITKIRIYEPTNPTHQ